MPISEKKPAYKERKSWTISTSMPKKLAEWMDEIAWKSSKEVGRHVSRSEFISDLVELTKENPEVYRLLLAKIKGKN